jgi:hypothetical protein
LLREPKGLEGKRCCQGKPKANPGPCVDGHNSPRIFHFPLDTRYCAVVLCKQSALQLFWQQIMRSGMEEGGSNGPFCISAQMALEGFFLRACPLQPGL